MTKTISDLQSEAVHITALCQGAEVLYDHAGGMDLEASPDRRAAGNALYSLLPTIVVRMNALALELERMESEERRAQRKAGD
jgi:hypothetical protein